MKSTNPILNNSIMEQAYAISERPMTIEGTTNKLIILSLIMLCSAVAVFYQFSLQHFDFVNILMLCGLIISLILGLLIPRKVELSPYLTPIYAFAQGALISGLSCQLEASFPGIVIQAISMTFIVVLVVALLYRSGLIKATEKFRAVVISLTLAVALFYFISFILLLFGVNVPYFYYNSPLNIGINILIAGLAALSLILDFDFIEKGTKTPLPSLFEWYGAFGLMVTIIWLYVEILRLLSRFRDR